MNKLTTVLELDIDEDTSSILKVTQVIDTRYLPVGITMTGGIPDKKSLNEWWRGRSIPASRSGIRRALHIMKIAYPQQLITKCYGLSLSDQYWINPKHNPLDWGRINFFQNWFSDDVGNALFGQASPRGQPDLMSP